VKLPIGARAAAAQTLGHMKCKAAAPALVKALDESDSELVREALNSLRVIGAYDDVVIDKVVHVLREGPCRSTALWYLMGTGPKAKIVLPAVREATRNSRGRFRISAAKFLWDVGRDAKTAVPMLIDELGKGDGRTTDFAAGPLASIGAPAIPALVKLIGDSKTESVARRYAVHALGGMGKVAEPALPALQKLAKDKDPDLRRAAEEALRRISQE